MFCCIISLFFFFFNDTATTEIYTSLHTLSLHDALPISTSPGGGAHRETGRHQRLEVALHRARTHLESRGERRNRQRPRRRRAQLLHQRIEPGSAVHAGDATAPRWTGSPAGAAVPAR